MYLYKRLFEGWFNFRNKKVNMSSQDAKFYGFISPLAFLEVDESWGSIHQSKVNLEDILRILCTPELEHDVNSCVRRWKEISKETNRLLVVPCEQKFLERLIWPLRHAKSGYMVGNYLGTIALCGVVAEMLAILLYDIAVVSLSGKQISIKEQRMLFGDNFEKLGQHRRVEVLRVIGQIDNEVKGLFDKVRATRKKYLHLYTQPHEKLAIDAVATFDNTVSLVVKALGFGLNPDGSFTMRPDLTEYMKKLGVVSDTTE